MLVNISSVFLLCVIVGISSGFFRVKHPLSMGSLILFLSGVSCIMIGMEVSSWFGYVVFLIYVGALLVMFAYVAALAPNPRFGLDYVHFLGGIMVVVACFSVGSLYYPLGVTSILDLGFGGLGYMDIQLVMASFDGAFVLVGLGALLLLVLVGVCKICRFYKGPLRLF